MATKYGMFIEPNYVKTGDPYAKKQTRDDRDTGLNFKATVGKTGKTNDATFDKFTSTNLGDKYIDPLKVTLQAAAETRKKNITEKPFKATSPMKKSTTPGDFTGTLGGKVPYYAETVDVQKLKGQIPEQPKGIYTGPAKKGSFGMNKFTLSERTGHKGVAGEYEYHADPETLVHRRKLQQMEEDRKARVTELPFRPANPPKRGGFGVPNTTISKGKGVAGEWEYLIPTPDPNAQAAEEKKIENAFKPTNQHTYKRTNHIDYIHDPEVPKIQKEKETKRAEQARLAAAGPWRPSQGPKTDMIRSIIRMNI